MSHLRKRYAEVRVTKLSKASSIVGVLGQRQVGKSTLLNSVCKEYITFDRETILRQAKTDPETFLLGRTLPFGVDEAQLCPELFPALKEHVRTHKSVGQFILSGSVRFTSRKVIRESLTGRILNIELLPFSIAEAHGRANTDYLSLFNKIKSTKLKTELAKHSCSNKTEFFEHLEKGGLPGISLSRDAGMRDDRWQTHLDTLLNRDYRLLHSTTLTYDALRDALVYLAQNQGRPLELKKLSFASRISYLTIKKVLLAFEALFLIRGVPLSGDAKSTAYYLEDQGMASWLTVLSRVKSSEELEWDLARGLYSSLRHEIYYRPEKRGSIGSYRTKHGVIVHLVFETTDGKLGIVVTPDAEPRPRTIAAANAFLKKFPKAKVIIAYGGKEIVIKSNQHFWVPYWMLV